ncbi:MAG: alpha/beta hydrolase [Mycobacterium sp.]
MPVHQADITVDVTEACGLDRRLSIVATAYLPPPERLTDSQTVVFALPGGGYSRGYFHMEFPGHAGYSQAAHHVDRGLIVVAIDHLGVGDSTPEVADLLRIEDIAAANDIAVREISQRLRDGDAVPGYPAVDVGSCVGMGQSMGGGVVVIMAGRHQSFDAVAVLGFSAIHTVLPLPRAEDASYAKNFAFSRDDAPGTFSVERASATIPDLLYPFFYEDVPPDILEADTAGGYPLRDNAPAFGSKSIPSCVVAMLSPGYISTEAAELTVPVFIGVGERDVAPEPHREPSAYSASSDITLVICDRMAHMHNFATTRAVLWDRLAHWCAAL